VLYIVAQFYGGDAAGQADANLTYGSYLAVVYAGAVFGGYIADRVIGYQRSILVGAVFMAAGLFTITIPDQDIFKLGLATIIVGNGMFKPNISAMVGQLYTLGDTRRDSGFTIFYMGINTGALIAPVLTQVLAQNVFNTGDTPAYKIVFFAAGIGMLLSHGVVLHRPPQSEGHRCPGRPACRSETPGLRRGRLPDRDSDRVHAAQGRRRKTARRADHPVHHPVRHADYRRCP